MKVRATFSTDSVEVEAFADDANFLDEPKTAAAANALYKHLYTLRIGGALNDTKSGAMSFGVTENDARAAGLCPDIPWATATLPDGTSATGGIVLYGAPIGDHEFVSPFLTAAVNETAAILKRMSHMEKRQHKLILLRMSLCKKLQHIQRLVPTHDHLDILQRFDTLIMMAVEDLLLGKGTFTDLAATLTNMPAGLGGLGIESAEARADACYYSAYTSAFQRLTSLTPQWAEDIATQGRDIQPIDAMFRAAGRLNVTPRRPACLNS